ncbi:hypothetical protein HWI92_17880 [Dyadobacter sandarakinus]|uniref:Nucleotidyltransferase n=2 Tax=Dyadobacter sandarakinus TaxID=2747268 RepID=A0ABX7IEJ8_9BACT|nr:hypothetical protein HWI92_17880 [Dyadobacter sandarakinus]
MDISSDDVLRLLSSLNQHQVKYLLVGGMAGVVHGHIRTTQDMDLWVKSGSANTIAFVQALKENNVAGADLLMDMPLIFGWTSVRFGETGFELDLGHTLKAFNEQDFDACFERSLLADFEGVPFHVIHLKDLITEKKASGRFKDLGDMEELQKIWDSQQKN